MINWIRLLRFLIDHLSKRLLRTLLLFYLLIERKCYFLSTWTQRLFTCLNLAFFVGIKNPPYITYIVLTRGPGASTTDNYALIHQNLLFLLRRDKGFWFRICQRDGKTVLSFKAHRIESHWLAKAESRTWARRIYKFHNSFLFL